MKHDRPHPNSLESIMGDLVKKWWDTIPEAIRALEKFNRENKCVLVQETEEKRRILDEIRLKNFKGTATGQRMDLTVYKKVFEPIADEASDQKQPLPGKGVS